MYAYVKKTKKKFSSQSNHKKSFLEIITVLHKEYARSIQPGPKQFRKHNFGYFPLRWIHKVLFELRASEKELGFLFHSSFSYEINRSQRKNRLQFKLHLSLRGSYKPEETKATQRIENWRNARRKIWKKNEKTKNSPLVRIRKNKCGIKRYASTDRQCEWTFSEKKREKWIRREKEREEEREKF